MDSITLIIGVIAGAILGIAIPKAFKKESDPMDQSNQFITKLNY